MAADLEYTHIPVIPAIIEDLNRAFQSGLTRPLEYRKKQLRGLYNLIDEHEDEFVEALRKDLRKPKMEIIGGELPPIREDILYFLKNLGKLAKPKKVKPRMSVNAMDRIEVRRDPLGTVLIIGAWNYPAQLLLLPAVGAIAAGNTIVLKPSEVAGHTAALITKLIPRYIDPKCYQVVNGAVEETTELLKHKFDHIFYTGNGNVGKIISTAAAKHLTPVTLELGGKSPAIVADDADLSIVANRIAFGKWYNAGQTCIAPDYVLIHPTRAPALIANLKKSITTFFGDDPKRSPDYSRIVSTRQFDRLVGLLEDRPQGSHVRGGIAFGGGHDRDELYIAPTILADVDGLTDPAMLDEIFGPILPILTVASINEAIRFINAGDTPLALYLFTNKNRLTEKILTSTRSGAAVVNDCIIHAAELSLPFGGVGGSGTGNYHGIYSFNVFTHERAAMIKTLGLEGVNAIIKYPPYNERKLSIIRFLTTSTPWFKKGRLKAKIAGSIFVLLAVLIIVARRRR